VTKVPGLRWPALPPATFPEAQRYPVLELVFTGDPNAELDLPAVAVRELDLATEAGRAEWAELLELHRGVTSVTELAEAIGCTIRLAAVERRARARELVARYQAHGCHVEVVGGRLVVRPDPPPPVAGLPCR